MYIEAVELSKKIRGKLILDKISLRMESGRIYGLCGQNGSGKTMLMRALCGLILPTQGYVEVDGRILGKDISFPDSVGVLIENPGFIPHYSGFKNLKILASLQNKIDDDAITGVLKQLSLYEVKDNRFKTYSLGMKQRLGIAAAIMESPEMLILDEPFNALDEKSITIVSRILEKKRADGALIVLSCHDRAMLESLSDEIFTVSDGRISM